MNPQGLAIASGSRGFPDQLTFLFISWLVTNGLQLDYAVLRSITLPQLNDINTLKLFFTERVKIISMIYVSVFNIIQKINWWWYLFINFKTHFASTAYWVMLFCLIISICKASIMVRIRNAIFLKRSIDNSG